MAALFLDRINSYGYVVLLKELSMPCIVQKTDLAKREDRAAVIQSAFNSNAMEGIFPSKETIELFDRFIDGCISLEDLKDEVLSKFRKMP